MTAEEEDTAAEDWTPDSAGEPPLLVTVTVTVGL